MSWLTLLALGALAPFSNALLRFQCSQLVVERLDPLVAPGSIPSPHLHQIVGGVSTCLLIHPLFISSSGALN